MNTRDLGYVALFAALIVALGIVPAIPLAAGVPITLQSMGVMLAGLVLGPKRGAMAALVVIALVAIGLPVLSGGRGGVGVFAGKTTGFLVGWVFGAFVTGWFAEWASNLRTSPMSVVFLGVIGIATGTMFGIAAAKLAGLFGSNHGDLIGLCAFLLTSIGSVATLMIIERRFAIDTIDFRIFVVASIIGGVFVVHALGIAWNLFYFKADLVSTFFGFSFPFIPGDLAKAVIAALVTVKVRDAISIERK